MKAEGWVYSATYGPRQGKSSCYLSVKIYSIQPRPWNISRLGSPIFPAWNIIRVATPPYALRRTWVRCLFPFHTTPSYTLQDYTPVYMCVVGETNAKCNSRAMNLKVKVEDSWCQKRWCLNIWVLTYVQLCTQVFCTTMFLDFVKLHLRNDESVLNLKMYETRSFFWLIRVWNAASNLNGIAVTEGSEKKMLRENVWM
jgi:hypothetical protein